MKSSFNLWIIPLLAGGLFVRNFPVLAAPVIVRSNGWTLNCEPTAGVLNISHEGLGPVLQGLRLNVLQSGGALKQLGGWTVKELERNHVGIHTAQPNTYWTIEAGPDVLTISTTTAEGVITGQAPASKQRIVARLLDTQGAPVMWTGTDEVKSGYGAGITRNPSFLPRRNPEVMYFALGQVSGPLFHSLFDRQNDVAIDFPEQTVMERSARDADLLEFTMAVPGNAQIHLIQDYFTKTLGLPFYIPMDDSYFSSPPAVWSSWDNYYGQVREEDITRNADWIAARLKPYGFQYVELDDGYDRGPSGEHYWIEKWNRERFPHGPKWLADYIRSKGLRAGLWLVPNSYAGAVEEHPQWYLHDRRDGSLVRDYSTPTLDCTNPEVLEFLRKEFAILNDWGFDYYKFDGEHDYLRYIPGVDLGRIADKSLSDPIAAYRKRLEVIRQVIGPHRFIEGCPAGTPLDGIGYFNSYFNGLDMYANWNGQHNLFGSINANAFFNHLVAYLMPGEGIELCPTMSIEETRRKRGPDVVRSIEDLENPVSGFGTTLAEARTAVSYVALTGVVYPVSSVMPELPQERVRLLEMTLPALPILPIDLFSRGPETVYATFKHTTSDDYIHNYPEILDLKVRAPSGSYDVAALTDWRSWKIQRDLSFADKLGLEPQAQYVVFDFWSQKLVGVFQGKMPVTIEPHDTRVLLIHRQENHPQLLGSSRHITGAYSILQLEWDGAHNVLRGTSQTIPGAAYTLWFYVPTGVNLAEASAQTANGEIEVRHELHDHCLSLTFDGQPKPVQWRLRF